MLLKITHLPLSKSTFYYQYMWPEYIAYFLVRCVFHCKLAQSFHLKNRQSSPRRAESISWCRCSQALGSPCLGTQLSLCIHSLLQNFWLEYEKWILLLLISEGLRDGASTFCCHIEQDSLMWACGGEIKGVPCSSIAAQWGSGGQWEEVYWGGAL